MDRLLLVLVGIYTVVDLDPINGSYAIDVNRINGYDVSGSPAGKLECVWISVTIREIELLGKFMICPRRNKVGVYKTM